jgi:hypothetical protein
MFLVDQPADESGIAVSIVLTPSEVASFDGRHRHVDVTGPLKLMRLCGKTAAGAASDPYGRFWFNEKFFWSLVDTISENASNTAQLNHYLRFLLREFTAVCHDWNTFALIYQLSLPAGVPMNAVVGRVAPQPFCSSAAPARRVSRPHELLVGGEFQYIVDLRANSALRQYVQGPRPLHLHHIRRSQ